MALNFTLPSEAGDRRKLLIAVGIIAACVIWLGFYSISNMSHNPPMKPLDSPGWRIANEVTAKLNADPALLDIVVGVASEKPLKFNVVGAVYKQADLDRLPDALKDAGLTQEYENKVEVIKRH